MGKRSPPIPKSPPPPPYDANSAGTKAGKAPPPSRAQMELGAILQAAAKKYSDNSGDSLTEYMVPPMRSVEELVNQIERQNDRFSSFRARKAKLFGALQVTLRPVQLVGDVASGTAGEAFPATQGIFAAVMHLVNAANDVSSTYDSIVDLFEQLTDFTGRLNVYVRVRMSEPLRQKLVEILASLFEVFVLARKEVKRGRFKAFFRRIAFMESPVGPAFERFKTLILAEERQVIADTYGGVSQIDTKTDRVEALVNQVNEHVEHLRLEQHDRISTTHQDKLREILEPSPFPEDFFKSFNRSRVQGTGNWILEDEGLQYWLQGNTQYLFLSGAAGSGKSFLATRLISWGNENLSHLGYFYFRADNPETRSVLQALRDVAYQLSESDAYYAKQVTRSLRSPDDIKTISSAFRRLFVEPFVNDDRGRLLHVFLDGIDEAEAEDVRELLALLAPDDGDTQPPDRTRIQMALIGRSYVSDSVTDALERLDQVELLTKIVVTSDRNLEDVSAFIVDGVMHSRLLSKSPQDFKHEVIHTMENKADGLFIMAKFMIADMSRKRHPSSVLRSLESYPKEITGMLKKTLASLSAAVSEDEAADLNEMLRWVACAEEALTMEQLEAASILRFGDPPFRFEETLRGQYACFFDLEREDGLSTDDLIKDLERARRDKKRDSTPSRSRRSSSAGKESPKSMPKLIPGGSSLSPGLRSLSPAQNFANSRRRSSPVPLARSVGRRSSMSISRSPIRSPDLADSGDELEFRSKKSSTKVTFSHNSVREFFSDDDNPTSTREGSGPTIGFDAISAKLHVLSTCLKIFTDEAWFKRQRLGRGRHAIRQYAAWYWQEHVAAIDPGRLSPSQKAKIGSQVYRMLTDEKLIYQWSIMYLKNDEGLEVLTDRNIKALRKWMSDGDVLANLDANAKAWATKAAAKPTGLFQNIGDFYARAWLEEGFDKYVPTRFCFTIVQSLAFMEAGHDWSYSSCHWADVPVPQRIARAVEWAGCEKNGHWYRRVGSTYLTSGMHTEALAHYDEAIKLEGNSVETNGRKAFCLFRDQRHKESLDLALECVDVEEKNLASGKLTEAELSMSKWRLYRDHFLIAQCAYRLKQVDKSIEYFHKAVQSGADANLDGSERFEPIVGLLEVLAIENKHAEIMKVVLGLSLHATGPRQEQSRLIDFLLFQFSKPSVMNWIPKAAVRDGKAEFIIERLEMAIGTAHASREPLRELYLRLTLGATLIYNRDIDDAINLFEMISLHEYRPRGNVPTRQAHAISFQRLASLYREKALHAGLKGTNAEGWIKKLEAVQERQSTHQNLDMPANMLGSDVNVASIYLALFYRLGGRPKDAESLLATLIVDSCEILEDEDLRNDEYALENLVKLFIAADDVANAKALAVSMRRLNPDAQIPTPEDSPVHQRKRRVPKLPDIQSSSRSCAQCLDNISARENFYLCRFCMECFCGKCHRTVIKAKDNTVAVNRGDKVMCRSDHEWIVVPPLNKVLHSGEILVRDGEVAGFEEWKNEVKARWVKKRARAPKASQRGDGLVLGGW